MNWADKIFKTHSRSEFKDLAFDVFNYQINHCEVYSHYVSAIGITNPISLNDIPFLPISFFKSKRVISNQFDQIECFFKSSAKIGREYSHWMDVALRIDLKVVIPERYRTKVRFMSDLTFRNG